MERTKIKEKMEKIIQIIIGGVVGFLILFFLHRYVRTHPIKEGEEEE